MPTSDTAIATLLAQLFPASDPGVLLQSQFSDLPHPRRALVRGAVAQRCPGVAQAAIDAIATWEDIDAYLDSKRHSPTPVESRLTLRPLLPSDTPALYSASMNPSTAHRWRLRGRTISPSNFETHLHDGVLAQFACEVDGHLVGLVVGYNADLVSGNCYVASLRTMTIGKDRGVMIEGTMRLIEYLFQHFNLRKLYFEVPAYNLHLLQPFVESGLFVQEGCLHGHLYGPSGFEDMHVLALYRELWKERTSGWFGNRP